MTRSFLSGATSLAVLATSSLCLAQPAPAAPPPATPPAATPPAAVPPAAEPPATEPPAASPPAAVPPAAEPAPTTAAPPSAEAAPPPVMPIQPATAASATVSSEGLGASSTSEAVTTSEDSWFARAPIAMTLGEGAQQLTLTFYGVLQADFIYDTTRSYNESIGSSVVARGDTFEGTIGRAQASMRSTRLGLAFDSKAVGGITPSAVFEGDFAGNQPSDPPDTSEARFYDSPAFRMRHAYVDLESNVLDVLVGQTYHLFARQDIFNPGARSTQLRVSHTFGEAGPVGVEIAGAAVRPVQRDSELPDGTAALRLNVNGWQGLATPRGIAKVRPLSLGVSGLARQFDVDAFTPPPTQRSNSLTGWGLAVDLLLPVLAADDEFDRGNKLTLLASFVTGTGIADLAGATGGAKIPPLPNPARANPPPEYDSNVDEGLVSFDTLGVLNTIDWQVLRVGAQYFLPPNGRVNLAANFSQAYSANMHDLFPQGGAEIELLTHVADRTRQVDATLSWDVTPSVRTAVGGAYTTVEYLDGDAPKNLRGLIQAMYFF